MVTNRRAQNSKERTSIIRVAMHTKNLIDQLKKKEIQQEERDKWNDIQVWD